MKKNILNLTALALIATTLVYTGCKKEDTTAPVITLNGDAAMTISLNSNFSDPGATATDDEDGEITPTVSGTVNKDLTGTYTLTYSATDAAGNVAEETRTVTVVNDAAYLEGTYHGSETDINGPYTYNPSNDASKWNIVTASTTQNNKVTLTRLGDFANNTVTLEITGTTVTLPQQTVTGVGTGSATCDVHDRQSQGSGSISGTTINLTYNDEKKAPCTGTRSGVVAIFTKQ